MASASDESTRRLGHASLRQCEITVPRLLSGGFMPFERPIWPDGARCAVTLTFDNFGESLDLLRFGHAGGASADGVYAPRRGVARVLDLLERHHIPGTFFIEGWNARKYASLV